MSFASPFFLVLFIPLILGALWLKKTRKPATLGFSNLSLLTQLKQPYLHLVFKAQPYLRFFILSLMVIALARPQTVDIEKEVLSEGVDILLALDVSGSMRAEDFQPENRLEVAKRTISEFISQRQSDKIGLVVFSQAAFTQMPLTLDYYILKQSLTSLSFDMVGPGTAIGMAVATSLNRLKDSQTKSKIIILLTDGVNNSGSLDPLTAANLAKEMGVKVYTVGVGKRGKKKVSVTDPDTGRKFKVVLDLDETTLKKIATITGGQYFYAANEQSLKTIYKTINELETTKIKTKIYREYYDYFMSLLKLILCLLLSEFLIYKALFRRVL